MGAQLIPQEVRDLAAGIADDIERNGHWQGVQSQPHFLPFATDKTRVLPCCLRFNPTLGPDWVSSPVGYALEALIPADKTPWGVVRWNDETPTAEVLATLRKIAAGERP